MLKKRSTKELLGNTVAETAVTQNPGSGKKDKPKRQKPELRKILRNRAMLAVMCVITAILIAFVAMPMVQSYVSKSVDAVRLTRDVRLGDKLTADDLTLTQIGGLNAAPDTIGDIDSAVGSYARLDMLKHDVLQKKKISGSIITDDKYLLTLPPNKMAMSITMANFSSSLSAKIRAGDVIRLYSLIEVDGVKQAVAPTELQYVEVLAVTNENVQDIENGARDNTDIESDDKQIDTITLAVNDAQALALTALSDEMRAALVYRGEDTDKKTEMLAAQAEHIEKMKGARAQ